MIDLPDFASTIACRWQPQRGLVPVGEPRFLDPADLVGVERQRSALLTNTAQFVRGLPANNALLWGARGTGKSSLAKAMLAPYAAEGLRLIEVEPHDLVALPDIVAPLAGLDRAFVIFADDLSFGGDDPGIRALKAVLEGSIAAAPDNVLVYATSNRRHLLPEQFADQAHARRIGDEIHPGEAVDEKVSLSDRFGLWLSFYAFDQSTYLQAVDHWLQRLGAATTTAVDAALREAALVWARRRGGRSGRAANQFARDWVGRQRLGATGAPV